MKIRTQKIFDKQYLKLAIKTDFLFAYLFIFQWFLGIIFAYFISPLSWSGELSQIHIHVYAAIFLGGLIAIFPIYLIFKNPGATINRMVIAVSQILFSSLFIHLTAGRIETHFHIFGSLAFLAIYRDWRPVVIASVITALDHLVRGIFWPESIYGVLSATPWRALEHAAWVIFEDFVLFYSIKLARSELWSASGAQAKLEREREQINLLLDIAVIANEAQTLNISIKKTLEKICIHTQCAIGHAYIVSDEDSNLLVSTKLWYIGDPSNIHNFQTITEKTTFRLGEGLPGRVLEVGKAVWIDNVATDKGFLRYKAASGIGINSAFAFPIFVQGKIIIILEFFSENIFNHDDNIFHLVEHVGHQLGQVSERENAEKNIKQLNQSLEEKVLQRTQQLIDKNTELAQQQQIIVNSSKMSSLGEMAGAVAHEINNPLAIIKNISSQIQEVVDDEPLNKIILKSMASKVESTIDRISKIVKGLRSFSRDGSKDPFQKIIVSILLDDTLSFCNERFKNNGIDLSVEEFDQDLSFEGRITEISQVLLNLLNNSSDAISNLDKKWIKLSITDETNWIYIKITDSGNGIPKEINDKMFRPFFTTKEIGKGTGIGLSISQGIINAHQGQITIDHQNPHTCFIIKLPKVQLQAA